MKTKKLVSLFLAVAMIFAVLTVSVSADNPLYVEYEGEYFSAYATSGYSFYAIGVVNYIPDWNSLALSTQIDNSSTNSLCVNVRTQCAIEYSDGTYDFDYNGESLIIAAKDNQSSALYMTPNANKTIIAFNSEFNIGSVDSEELWIAGAYEYYPGING